MTDLLEATKSRAVFSQHPKDSDTIVSPFEPKPNKQVVAVEEVVGCYIHLRGHNFPENIIFPTDPKECPFPHCFAK